MDDGVKTEMT